MVGAFERFKIAERLDDVRIASIGTGPSSELYAYKEYIEQNSNINQQFSFVGFDDNLIWQPIWKHTLSNMQNVKYESGDFFKYYNDRGVKPNVILFNYLLSDMAKFRGHEVTANFLTQLIEFTNDIPHECYIICNDIMYVGSGNINNIDSSFPAYLFLFNLVGKDAAYKKWGGSYSKFNNYADCKTYRKFFGSEIGDVRSKVAIQQDGFGISPFETCTSMQLVIKKL